MANVDYGYDQGNSKKGLGYQVPGAPSYVRSNADMSGYKTAADFAKANNVNTRDIYTTDIRPYTEKNYPTPSTNTNTPRSSGGSGGSGGGSYAAAAPAYDPRQGLIDYYKTQNENARKSAIDAIEARLKTQLGLYENQFGEMNDNYDSLINQAEVNYYKGRRGLREALANRGQLDSGLGRQETLNLNIARGNEVSNINRQRQKTRDDYNNAVASVRAEAEADKATVNNQYANELRAALAQIMAQYA